MKKETNTKKVICSDYRITSQEKYLYGAVFQKKEYKAKSREWDHDHCRFCWAKFSEDPTIGLTEGFYTENRESWVCETCFHDFIQLFDFKIK